MLPFPCDDVVVTTVSESSWKVLRRMFPGKCCGYCAVAAVNVTKLLRRPGSVVLTAMYIG
jgi:hypothetical protein